MTEVKEELSSVVVNFWPGAVHGNVSGAAEINFEPETPPKYLLPLRTLHWLFEMKQQRQRKRKNGKKEDPQTSSRISIVSQDRGNILVMAGVPGGVANNVQFIGSPSTLHGG